MSDPSWLQDDDDSPIKAGLKSPNDATARLSSPNNGIPRPPPMTKPAGASPSRKQVQRNNARLEEEGLDFLTSPVADSMPQVVKETRSGVLIIDEDLAPAADPSTIGGGKAAMGAPVHFLRRMREAEEKRQQRLEKIANGEKPSTATGGARKGGIGARPGSSSSSTSAVYKRLGSASLRRTASTDATGIKSPTNALNSSVSGASGAAIGADGGIVETETVDLSVVPPLSDDDKADYKASIAAFGEPCIAKLRSNRYQHRVESLRDAKEQLVSKKHERDDDDLMRAEEEGDADELGAKQVTTPNSGDKKKEESDSNKKNLDSSSDEEDEFGVKKERTAAEEAAHKKRRDERRQRREEEEVAARLGVGKDGSGGFKMTVSSANADTAGLIAMAEVLSIALKDSLHHVVIAGCELLDAVLENYTFFDKQFVDDHLKNTIAALVTRLKDSNSRSKEAAVATLLNLSAHANVGPAVVVAIVAKSVPMPAGADSTDAIPAPSARDDWRYCIAKIDLCHSILDAKPRYISAVSDECLRIATHGLQSANPQARKRAAAFFGLVRVECGQDGIRRYLSTISPATIKMLKQEIGVGGGEDALALTLSSGGGGMNATGGATATAAKLAAHMALDDEAAAKEESEDMAAFEGDGDAESMSEEQHALVEYLRGQFPALRSFALLFSSRWNLRERVILRLHGLLEDKAMAITAAGGTVGNCGASGEGGGVLAKLTAANVAVATSPSGLNASLSLQQKLSPPPSSSAAKKPPIAKRFMQNDDSDEEEDEAKKRAKAMNASSASAASAPAPSLTKRPGTGSGVRERLEASRAAAQEEKAKEEAEAREAARPISLVTSEQLGAVAGICEKSFTDSVPAVAAAAIKLLRIALSGYSAEHQPPTPPPPPTPLEGAARKPPRAGSASIRSGGSSSTAPLAASASAALASDDVPAALGLLIPRLVSLTSGGLTAEAAQDALVLTAELPFITLNGAIQHILAMERPELVAKASVKSVCARLDACAHLLASCGNANNASSSASISSAANVGGANIDLYRLMNFATAAFQHREPKARTSAAALVCEVYKRVGDRITPHLELIKGAVGDDLRAKMAKISIREKQMGGGAGRVRLAVFGGAAGGGVLSAGGSPTPTPPSQPSPQRADFRKTALGGGAAAAAADSEPTTPAADMAQGKNRNGNLVFS